MLPVIRSRGRGQGWKKTNLSTEVFTVHTHSTLYILCSTNYFTWTWKKTSALILKLILGICFFPKIFFLASKISWILSMLQLFTFYCKLYIPHCLLYNVNYIILLYAVSYIESNKRYLLYRVYCMVHNLYCKLLYVLYKIIYFVNYIHYFEYCIL